MWVSDREQDIMFTQLLLTRAENHQHILLKCVKDLTLTANQTTVTAKEEMTGIGLAKMSMSNYNPCFVHIT